MSYFSIIIPTYNRAALLGETLDSVLQQSFRDYEVIVVDDGSTDGTAQMMEGYGGKVQFLQQKNNGPGVARNLAASRASGAYLAFLDSDDVIFPWSLETYAQVISAQQTPAFLAGKPFRFTQSAQMSNLRAEPLRTKAFADYFAGGDEYRWWGASSFVIRADAFRAVGGFTTAPLNSEDGDLAMRLGVSPGFVQLTSPYTFGYREHPGSFFQDRQRTRAGAWDQIRMEQAGQYPGGRSRARERWRILTRQLRPVTLDFLRPGLRKDAWGLYGKTFRWNVALGRWKYLAGFPVKALVS